MNKYVIGIDIGGTNTMLGVVDIEGHVYGKSSFRTDSFSQASEFVIALSDEIKSLIKKSHKEIVGIGIGAPNANYYTGTIEDAPNLKWKGCIRIVEELTNILQIKVIMTNDANAAAIGERIYGGAKDMNDFIMVTLGTGVGSGFVSNGELIYGADGFAGELGHTVVFPNGRLCGCGRRGCLETYCSATGIVATAKELLAENKYKSILVGKEITAKEIYLAAKNSDELAIKAFDITTDILSLSLANAVAMTSPSAIFLFGGLAQAEEFIIEPTKRKMEEKMLNIFKNKVQIIKSALPENTAAIIGAAALIFNDTDNNRKVK